MSQLVVRSLPTFCAVVVLGAIGSNASLEAQEVIRTVALSAENAVGTPSGSNWMTFGTPVLNDFGRVAFIGRLSDGTSDVNSDNDRGIWSEVATGELELVARKGDAAPGTESSVAFYDFYQLRLSNEGHMAIGAQVRPAPNQPGSYGIWRSGPTDLVLIVRNEMPAAGMPEGLVFRGGAGHNDNLAMNAHGEIVFTSTVGPADTPNYTLVDSGIWRTNNGLLELVAGYEQDAPGLPGKFYSSFGGVDPVMNDSGEIAFQGFLAFLTVGNQALWSGPPEALRFHVQSGKNLPAPLTGTHIYDLRTHIAPNPIMNNQGDVAFLADGDTGSNLGSQGIWAYRNGSYQAIALAGQPAAGMPPDERLGIFTEFAINGSGEVAIAGLSGKPLVIEPPEDDPGGDPITVLGEYSWGVWHEKNGLVNRVVGQGDAALGAAAGETFGYFADVVINGLGQIAFRASLIARGEVLDTDADSIWAQDVAGNLKLIARVGDELSSEYRGADVSKIVATLDFIGNTGNQDGLPSGFNEFGQLAFLATFTDGSSGVFVSNRVAVPEPNSVFLLVGLVPIVIGSRFRIRPIGTAQRAR